MTDSGGLVGWLLTQISEDEERARFGDPFDKPGNHEGDYSRDWYDAHADAWHTALCGWRVGEGLDDDCTCGVPARVLAECAAKKAIIELHDHPDQSCWEMHRGVYGPGWPEGSYAVEGESWAHPSLELVEDGQPCETLRALALPYADRPGYQEAWRADV